MVHLLATIALLASFFALVAHGAAIEARSDSSEIKISLRYDSHTHPIHSSSR